MRTMRFEVWHLRHDCVGRLRRFPAWTSAWRGAGVGAGYSRRWSSSEVRFGVAAEALFLAVADSVDMILGEGMDQASISAVNL